MKELEDITIKLYDLENVTYDVVIEFLEDNHIKHEVISIENQRTEDTRSEHEKLEDWEWEQADLYNDDVRMGLR